MKDRLRGLPVSKRAIEYPIEQIIAEISRAKETPVQAPPAAPSKNPLVEPGKVNWHADFATACAMALRSRKPVLLFHMLGRLDENFC